MHDEPLNPIKLYNLIPRKFQSIIKFRSIGCLIICSWKYSKKFDLFLNSSLSQKKSKRQASDDLNKFQNESFKDTIINEPTK